MTINIKDTKDGYPQFTFDFSDGINCKGTFKVKDTTDFLYLVGEFSISGTVRKIKTDADNKFDGYDDDYTLDSKIAIGRIRKTESTMYGKTYTPTEWDKLAAERIAPFNDSFIDLRLRLGELYKIDFEEDKADGKDGWESRYLKIEIASPGDELANKINAVADTVKSYSPGGSKFKSTKERLTEKLEFLTDNNERIMQTVTDYVIDLHYSEALQSLRGDLPPSERKITMTDDRIIAVFSAIVNSL